MNEWTCALTLDSQRQVIGGSEKALADAIRRGADLRINTEFFHNEHLDPGSTNAELVCEVSEFAVTYLLRDSWVAALMNLRQPVNPPEGFGPRPSMSLFLYNQNGQQAVARPFLDGRPGKGIHDPLSCDTPPNMPKYHALDSWDADSTAPSSNFIYDFEAYRYFVCDHWAEVLAHDHDGKTQSGSISALLDAFLAGCAIKVGIRGLCADLGDEGEDAPDHELFVRTGSGYFGRGRNIFSAGSHPLVRVQPQIPVHYKSGNWDFGWLVICTDGTVTYRRCDPFMLAFKDIQRRCPVRWFTR